MQGLTQQQLLGACSCLAFPSPGPPRDPQEALLAPKLAELFPLSFANTVNILPSSISQPAALISSLILEIRDDS